MPPVKKPVRQRRRHFLREWRDFHGKTQEQVAAVIGVSPTTYGRIENGAVPYNQDFLELAAYALQCEPWDLLNRDPNAKGDVVDLVRQLDKAKRDEAAEYIRFLAQRKA